MGVEQGYSKIASNGLAFAYDTGDVANSWRGKPTTNILTGVGYTYGFNNGPLFYSQYGTETSFIPGLGGNVTNHYCNFFNNYPGGSGNCCPSPFTFGGFSVSPSTTYTYQIIYRTPDGYANANYMYHYEYGPGGYVTEYGLWDSSRLQDLGNGWTHAWGTFTSNANTNSFACYLFHYQYTWTKIQVAGVMLTQGNNIIPPTQFLAPQASRSNTNSLLDVSGGGGTLTLNNTYDSNAQINFDGVSNFISLNTLTPSPTGLTMSVVARINSASSSWVRFFDFGNGQNSDNLLLCRYAASSNIFFGVYNGTPANPQSTVGGTLQFDQLAMYTATADGSNFRIYVNGQLVHTAANSTVPSPTTRTSNYLGRSNWPDPYLNGQIPVAQIYNRALSASEIRDNYNHYKTRFNLP